MELYKFMAIKHSNKLNIEPFTKKHLLTSKIVKTTQYFEVIIIEEKNNFSCRKIIENKIQQPN